MAQYDSIETPQDYVNYTFNVSAKGTAHVAGELAGLSNTVSTVLGDIAFKTSEFLAHTEMAAIGIGAAFSAAFIAAGKDAVRFQQQVANVKAIGGESVNANLIGDRAMEFSNRFGMATSSMTEGLEALARAGITTTDVMAGVLEEGVKLSKLEGIDLEESINSLISTTNLLSVDDVDMNAPEYAQALKEMNQHIVSTSESAPINAQNIMQTLQHAGGYVSAANIDQDDLFAVIAQLGSRGTKGEMAGTALRAFIAAGQKDQAQRALKRIGLDVTDLWTDNGEVMLSISEMKDVLDNALDARGYTKQEKLEFYSDFAGYKQANQIMKIDTTEVRQYKETIANAWDLGTKLNTILGTTRGNLDRIYQTGVNFMTKVGGKILPIVNAILVPIRWGLELWDKIPFSHSITAVGLIYIGFKTVLNVINKLVPAVGGMFSSFDDGREKVRGIRGEFHNLARDIEMSKETVGAVFNRDKDELRRQHGARRGPSAKAREQAELHVGGVLWQQTRDYQELGIRFSEIDRFEQESWLQQIKGTKVFQDEYNRYIRNIKNKNQKAAKNIEPIERDNFEENTFLNNISNYTKYIWDLLKNKDAPKDNREQNKEAQQNGQGGPVEIHFPECIKICPESLNTLAHMISDIKGDNNSKDGQNRQYNDNQSSTNTSNKDNNIPQQESGNFENVTVIKIEEDNKKEPRNKDIGKEILDIKKNINGFYYGNYNFKGGYQNKQQLDAAYTRALDDLNKKIQDFSNIDVNNINETQRKRLKKSLIREQNEKEFKYAMDFAIRANSSDIQRVISSGVYRKPTHKNVGIRDAQIRKMAEMLNIEDEIGPIDNIEGPDNRERQLKKIHQAFINQNTITIDDILDETSKIWKDQEKANYKPRFVPTYALQSDMAMSQEIARTLGISTQGDIVKNIQKHMLMANDEDINKAINIMFKHMKDNNKILAAIEAEEIKYVMENIARIENTYDALGIELKDKFIKDNRPGAEYSSKQSKIKTLDKARKRMIKMVEEGLIDPAEIQDEYVRNYFKDWIGTSTPGADLTKEAIRHFEDIPIVNNERQQQIIDYNRKHNDSYNERFYNNTWGKPTYNTEINEYIRREREGYQGLLDIKSWGDVHGFLKDEMFDRAHSLYNKFDSVISIENLAEGLGDILWNSEGLPFTARLSRGGILNTSPSGFGILTGVSSMAYEPGYAREYAQMSGHNSFIDIIAPAGTPGLDNTQRDNGEFTGAPNLPYIEIHRTLREAKILLLTLEQMDDLGFSPKNFDDNYMIGYHIAMDNIGGLYELLDPTYYNTIADKLDFQTMIGFTNPNDINDEIRLAHFIGEDGNSYYAMEGDKTGFSTVFNPMSLLEKVDKVNLLDMWGDIEDAISIEDAIDEIDAEFADINATILDNFMPLRNNTKEAAEQIVRAFIEDGLGRHSPGYMAQAVEDEIKDIEKIVEDSDIDVSKSVKTTENLQSANNQLNLAFAMMQQVKQTLSSIDMSTMTPLEAQQYAQISKFLLDFTDEAVKVDKDIYNILKNIVFEYDSVELPDSKKTVKIPLHSAPLRYREVGSGKNKKKVLDRNYMQRIKFNQSVDDTTGVPGIRNIANSNLIQSLSLRDKVAFGDKIMDIEGYSLSNPFKPDKKVSGKKSWGIINTDTGITCINRADGGMCLLGDDCYAYRSTRTPAGLLSQFAKMSYFYHNTVDQITKDMNARGLSTIRINQEGDFNSVDGDFAKMIDIAKANPDKRMYAYTKNLAVLKYIEENGLPNNFTMNNSLGTWEKNNYVAGHVVEIGGYLRRGYKWCMGVCTACEQCLNDMNQLVKDPKELGDMNKITNIRKSGGGGDPLTDVKPTINRMTDAERILYFSYIETLMTKQGYAEAEAIVEAMKQYQLFKKAGKDAGEMIVQGFVMDGLGRHSPGKMAKAMADEMEDTKNAFVNGVNNIPIGIIDDLVDDIENGIIQIEDITPSYINENYSNWTKSSSPGADDTNAIIVETEKRIRNKIFYGSLKNMDTNAIHDAIALKALYNDSDMYELLLKRGFVESNINMLAVGNAPDLRLTQLRNPETGDVYRFNEEYGLINNQKMKRIFSTRHIRPSEIFDEDLKKIHEEAVAEYNRNKRLGITEGDVTGENGYLYSRLQYEIDEGLKEASINDLLHSGLYRKNNTLVNLTNPVAVQEAILKGLISERQVKSWVKKGFLMNDESFYDALDWRKNGYDGKYFDTQKAIKAHREQSNKEHEAKMAERDRLEKIGDVTDDAFAYAREKGQKSIALDKLVNQISATLDREKQIAYTENEIYDSIKEYANYRSNMVDIKDNKAILNRTKGVKRVRSAKDILYRDWFDSDLDISWAAMRMLGLSGEPIDVLKDILAGNIEGIDENTKLFRAKFNAGTGSKKYSKDVAYNLSKKFFSSDEAARQFFGLPLESQFEPKVGEQYYFSVNDINKMAIEELEDIVVLSEEWKGYLQAKYGFTDSFAHIVRAGLGDKKMFVATGGRLQKIANKIDKDKTSLEKDKPPQTNWWSDWDKYKDAMVSLSPNDIAALYYGDLVAPEMISLEYLGEEWKEFVINLAKKQNISLTEEDYIEGMSLGMDTSAYSDYANNIAVRLPLMELLGYMFYSGEPITQYTEPWDIGAGDFGEISSISTLFESLQERYTTGIQRWDKSVEETFGDFLIKNLISNKSIEAAPKIAEENQVTHRALLSIIDDVERRSQRPPQRTRGFGLKVIKSIIDDLDKRAEEYRQKEVDSAMKKVTGEEMHELVGGYYYYNAHYKDKPEQYIDKFFTPIDPEKVKGKTFNELGFIDKDIAKNESYYVSVKDYEALKRVHNSFKMRDILEGEVDTYVPGYMPSRNLTKARYIYDKEMGYPVKFEDYVRRQVEKGNFAPDEFMDPDSPLPELPVLFEKYRQDKGVIGYGLGTQTDNFQAFVKELFMDNYNITSVRDELNSKYGSSMWWSKLLNNNENRIHNYGIYYDKKNWERLVNLLDEDSVKAAFMSGYITKRQLKKWEKEYYTPHTKEDENYTFDKGFGHEEFGDLAYNMEMVEQWEKEKNEKETQIMENREKRLQMFPSFMQKYVNYLNTLLKTSKSSKSGQTDLFGNVVEDINKETIETVKEAVVDRVKTTLDDFQTQAQTKKPSPTQTKFNEWGMPGMHPDTFSGLNIFDEKQKEIQTLLTKMWRNAFKAGAEPFDQNTWDTLIGLGVSKETINGVIQNAFSQKGIQKPQEDTTQTLNAPFVMTQQIRDFIDNQSSASDQAREKREKENQYNIRWLFNSLVLTRGQRGVIQKLLVKGDNQAIVQEIKRSNAQVSKSDAKLVADHLMNNPKDLDLIRDDLFKTYQSAEDLRRNKNAHIPIIDAEEPLRKSIYESHYMSNDEIKARYKENQRLRRERAERKREDARQRQEAAREPMGNINWNRIKIDDDYFYEIIASDEVTNVQKVLAEHIRGWGTLQQSVGLWYDDVAQFYQDFMETFVTMGEGFAIVNNKYAHDIFRSRAFKNMAPEEVLRQQQEQAQAEQDIFSALRMFDHADILASLANDVGVWEKTGKQINLVTAYLGYFAGILEKIGEIVPGLNVILAPLQMGIEKVAKAGNLVKDIGYARQVIKLLHNPSQMTAEEAKRFGLEKQWEDAQIFKMVFGDHKQFYKLLDEVAGDFTQYFRVFRDKAIDVAKYGFGFFMKHIAILGPIAAAVAVAVGGLWLSERNHAKALKETQEQLETTRKESSANLITYKDLNTQRKNETDIIKKQQLARKEAIALYQLELKGLERRNLMNKQSQLKGDGLWGEYGLRAAWQRFTHGRNLMSGEFESQYEQYEGLTYNIRRIKEGTLGNLFATSSQRQVAAFYDKNIIALGEIEGYSKELSKLYDVESRLIDEYGSIDEARNTKEFNDAVQEFSDATRLNGETAVKYLDWLETENQVDKARQVMQTEYSMIVAEATRNAYAQLYPQENFDNAKGIRDSMIYALSDEIYQKEYDRLWWDAFGNMLWGYLNVIIGLMNPAEWLGEILGWEDNRMDLANRHFKAAEAYTEGQKEMRDNQERIIRLGEEAADNADRRNYGTKVGKYSDKPFEFAVENALYMEEEAVREHMFIFNEIMRGGMTKAGESGVEGFKDGLNQHSPGDISKSVQQEMIYTKETFEDNKELIGQVSYDVGYESGQQYGTGFKDGLRDLYEQISTPEALSQTLKEHILYQQGLATPPNSNQTLPNNESVETTTEAAADASSMILPKLTEKILHKIGKEIIKEGVPEGLEALAKITGKTGFKTAAKTFSKIAPAIGPLVTAGFAIAEHNPFEKHYNEDGSEKRAFQSTGEVVGETAGAVAAMGLGLAVETILTGATFGLGAVPAAIIGAGVEMVASLILEPIGKAIGGTIGWVVDEIVNTPIKDIWGGFNDALGGIPGQIYEFIDKSPIGGAGHFIFDQLNQATGGWLGDTWNYVSNSSIAGMAGDAWNWISGAAGNTWDWISGAAGNTWNWLFGGRALDNNTKIGTQYTTYNPEDSFNKVLYEFITGRQNPLLGLFYIGRNLGLWGNNDTLSNDQIDYGLEDIDKMTQSNYAKNLKKDIFSNKKGENVSQDSSKSTIIIENININTEDDPEKIKTAFMNLVIEMQEQITPRNVSRTIGSTTTSDTQNNDMNNDTTNNQQNNQQNNNNPTL